MQALATLPPALKMYNIPRLYHPELSGGNTKVMPVTALTRLRSMAECLISDTPMAARSGLQPGGLRRFRQNRCQKDVKLLGAAISCGLKSGMGLYS